MLARLRELADVEAACRAGLRALGLLDDRRFAVEYAARQAARGRGPARLVADLLRRGSTVRSRTRPSARHSRRKGSIPTAPAARRASQLAALAPAVRKRRLLAYLARRGYGTAQAKELVEELCG